MFDRIKKYFQKNKLIKQEIKSLKYGDFIICNVAKYKNVKFGEGHQRRPYFVIEQKRSKIYCVPGSHKGKNGYMSLPIDNGNSYLFLSNGIFTLKKKHFIRKVSDEDDLSKRDLSNVAKKIKVCFKTQKYVDYVDNHIILEENDVIICDNKKYIVYNTSCNKEYIQCFEIYHLPRKGFVEVENNLHIVNKIVDIERKRAMYHKTYRNNKVAVIKEYLKRIKEEKRIQKRILEKKEEEKRILNERLNSLKYGDIVIYQSNEYMLLNNKLPFKAINRFTKEVTIIKDLESIKPTKHKLKVDEKEFLYNFSLS